MKREEKFRDYEGFVEKFKPKLTTDDCYTPPTVYDAILAWVREEYKIGEDVPIHRPFYPGGDYENFEYKADGVVIDNPPFSILAKIVDFYIARGIKFFLFAPHLTLFSGLRNRKMTAIVAAGGIVYENGAEISTSFFTNLEPEDLRFRTALSLHKAIKESQPSKKKRTAIVLPENVKSAALINLNYISKDIYASKEESYYVNALEAHKKEGKKNGIFGGAYILSDRVTWDFERQRLKAERQRLKAVLSEDEKAIIAQLNKAAAQSEAG